MSFFVITEPEYRAANWCANILSGLTRELGKKRLSLTVLDTLLDLNQHTILNEDAIFVIGASNGWLSAITKACESLFFNRVIVLSDKGLDEGKKGKYSMITSDSAEDTAVLYRYLQSYGKNRVALYGVNPHSPSNLHHWKSFLSCGGLEEDVFTVEASPSDCFAAFMERRQDYDAAICISDYAAVFLFDKMKDDRDFYVVCSDSTMLLHACYTAITHTWHDYKAFGRIALDFYDLLRRHSSLESAMIPISCRFFSGESTQLLPPRLTGIASENIGLKPNTDTDERRYLLKSPYHFRSFKASAEIYWGYCTGFTFLQKNSGEPNDIPQEINVYFANNRIQLSGAVDFSTAVAIGTDTEFYTYKKTGIFVFKSNFKAANGMAYTLLVQKENDLFTIWVDGYSALLSIRALPGFQDTVITLSARRFGTDSGGLKSLTVQSDGFSETVGFDNIDPAVLDKMGFTSTMQILRSSYLFVSQEGEIDCSVARHWFSGNGKNTPYYSSKQIKTLPQIPEDGEESAETAEVKRIELLFHSCSKIDFEILDRLLNNKTYTQIADDLFMSSSSIKYKLKKMFSLCGVSSKSELVRLVRKYT